MSCDNKCDLNTSSTGKCAYGENKLTGLLKTAQCVYMRLDKDVCQYVFELGKLQDYFQRFNLEDEVMFEAMIKRYNQLSEYLFVTLVNHLSITTNVRGIGEKIIKPVKQEYGTTTTIKYQNICKPCVNCSKCEEETKDNLKTNRFVGCRDMMKVQTTVNIATYDNISITKIVEDDIFKGYLLTIGKLSYTVNNYNEIKNLKETVMSQTNDNDFEEVDKITTNSIDTLYEFIDNQIRVLGDIEAMLVTNIEYVNKYIKKFKSL